MTLLDRFKFWSKNKQVPTSIEPSPDDIVMPFAELRHTFRPFANDHQYDKHINTPSGLENDIRSIQQALRLDNSNGATILKRILSSVSSQWGQIELPPYKKVTEFTLSEKDLSLLSDEINFLREAHDSLKASKVISISTRGKFASAADADPTIFLRLQENLIALFDKYEIKPKWQSFPTEPSTPLQAAGVEGMISVDSLTKLVHKDHQNKTISPAQELRQFLEHLYTELKPEIYPDSHAHTRRDVSNAIVNLYYALPEEFPICPLAEQKISPIKPKMKIDNFPEPRVAIPLKVITDLPNLRTSALMKEYDNGPLQHFNNRLHELISKHKVYPPQESVRPFATNSGPQ